MPKPATVTQAELASISLNDPLQFVETKYNSLFGLEIAPTESPLRAHNVARGKKAGNA